MTIDYCEVQWPEGPLDEEGLTFLPRAVEGIFDGCMPCQPEDAHGYRGAKTEVYNDRPKSGINTAAPSNAPVRIASNASFAWASRNRVTAG